MITITVNHNDDEVVVTKDGQKYFSMDIVGSVTTVEEFLEKLVDAISNSAEGDSGNGLLNVQLVKVDEDRSKTISEW